MSKYKVCVFDLDGTLVNSIADLCTSTNDALKKHSLPTHPLYKYKQFVGRGIANLVKSAMGSSSENEELFSCVYNDFCAIYNEKCLDETRPYDGIPELLDKLKENNIKICVLSNKADTFAKRIVSALFGENTFSAVWGKKEEYPRKPQPDSIFAMLKEIGCSPEECLYIGDSNVDVYTAKNAALDFCGVEWGFRGKDELKSCGAENIVKEPLEILKLVTENE